MRTALLLLVAVSASADVLVRESLTGRHVRTYTAPRCVVFKGPLRPFTCDGVPLFFNAAQPARVFDPNPVAAINDPSLMDENDSASAVPEHAYENAAADLLGPHVRIVDRQAPTTMQPDPHAPLVFDRGDDRFEPVNAAFHIDRMQRYLQSLGYVGAKQLVPYAIEVDALAFSGGDASFFLPSFTQPGRGTLFYGSGGTDDAEDADLVVHEYGHAILEWIAPGTFAGPFASESRALSEGFGDYLAFSAHYEQRRASGRDPFCFADWDARCWTDAPSEACAYPAGADCLRRLDSPRTMADYQRGDVSGVEHRNGQIWSSALREIFLKLGKRTTDVLVLESLFDAPPHPTFAVMARRMIETDRVLHGGVNRDAICAAMSARGIACDTAPAGVLTHVQSPERGIAIPDLDPRGIVSRITITDQRVIERVAVRVDIEHSARGDLRIELVAPDGTRVLLHNASFELARDINVTYGIDAATAEPLDVLRLRHAVGTWELRIADTRARDAGTLRSWALVFQFAGDEPPRQRPRGGSDRRMIPVVAHVATFASDVRIANVRSHEQTATLIFTRSGQDGNVSFSAIDVRLAPGQTVAFDDVLPGAFFAAGSGSLEILGDVVVMSRTYSILPSGGTIGSQVPADLEGTVHGGAPLLVTGLSATRDRYNLGITETGGRSGRVEVEAGGERTVYDILPLSHTQFAIDSASAEIAVIEGAARVVAYLSQIDAAGDAMVIPALERREPRTGIAPAISAMGATTRWQTDLWVQDPPTAFPATYGLDYTTGGERELTSITALPHLDAVATVWRRPGTAGTMSFRLDDTFAHSRITNGSTTQYVPFLPASSATQHLLFVENTAAYRTNIGFASRDPAAAEVVIYDAGGAEVERHQLLTLGGIAQLPVQTKVANGRAVVRFLTGSGRGYASLIDLRSGDATYMAGQ
jgi:subtilisin-like proprotein convertase family protein